MSIEVECQTRETAKTTLTCDQCGFVVEHEMLDRESAVKEASEDGWIVGVDVVLCSEACYEKAGGF